MRGRILPTCVALVIVAASGCAGGGPRRKVAVAEPPLVLPGEPEGEGGVVAAPTPRGMAFVDRHPLLSKPRDYYENSGDNKVVKSVAATVVGIPAGLLGELKQIVAGRPAELR